MRRVAMKRILVSFLHYTATLAIGGVVVWQVATYGDRRHGQAVVHVEVADVELEIDGDRRLIDAIPYAPLVFELKPGWHSLRMTRADGVTFSQPFEVQPGEDSVLVAWIPPETESSHPSNNPATTCR
jgi:hypothetical protein